MPIVALLCYVFFYSVDACDVDGGRPVVKVRGLGGGSAPCSHLSPLQ